MDDQPLANTPAVLDRILQDTDAVGFDMASEPRTGALLRALAAAKPGGRFLELGTGTGVGTSWLLAGMSVTAHLDTLDTDPQVMAIARKHLGHDTRVTFHGADGAEFLRGLRPATYDFIYADAWPGKFSHIDEALAALRIGGIYFVDDLLPQRNWPDGHGAKVARLLAELEGRSGFVSVELAWASGLMMLTRVAG